MMIYGFTQSIRRPVRLAAAILLAVLMLTAVGGLVFAAPAPPKSTPPAPLRQGSGVVLTATKTVTPAVVEAGQRLTYAIVISNSGTVSATNVTISDTLPLHTTFVPGSLSIDPPGAGGAAGTQPILADGITVTNGSLVTVTFAVTVASPLTDGLTIANTAAITSAQVSTKTVAQASATVNSAPVLHIAKLAADADGGLFLPGDRLTYTLTVSNSGNAIAHSVTVSDTLPANTALVPGSLAGGDSRGEAGGVLSWTLASLPPGAGNAINLTVAVTAAATLADSARIDNTAAVTSAEVAAPVSAQAAMTISRKADVSIFKTVTPANPAPGQTITYTLSFSNRGSYLAQGVRLTDTLPLTITPATVASSGAAITRTHAGVLTYTWQVQNLAPGQGGIITITGVVSGNLPAGTAIANTAQITTTDVDTGTTNNRRTVTATVRNVAPVATGVTLSTAEDTPVTGTISASDGNGDALTYTVSVPPLHGTARITSPLAGKFVYTPGLNYNGDDAFTVTVTDTGGLTDTARVTVTVTPVNDAPVLDPIGHQTIAEGQPLTVTATASDVDGDGLMFNLTNAPAGSSVSVGANTLIFTWTPAENQGPDVYTLTVTVTDDGTPKLKDSEVFTITVTEVNTAPVLSAIADKSVDELSPLSFTMSATDADLPANGLTFGLDNAPAGATVNPASGLFAWTPAEAQGPGAYTVTAIVTDTGSADVISPTLTDSQVFTITVNEVNIAPTLNAISNKTIDEEALLSFTMSATDADLPANGLSFGLDNAPAGATVNPASGLFTWTPAESQGPGVYAITAIVTDTGTPALTDSQVFTVTVTEIADVQITKTSPPSATAGSSSPLIYTLIARNNGPSAARNVRITDTLPAGTTLSGSPSPSQGSCSANAGVVTCNLGTIARDNLGTVVLNVLLDSSLTGTVENTATVGSDLLDRSPSNNTDSVSTAVNTEANLTLSVTDAPDPVLVGDTLAFTLTVTNLGPSDATGMVVTDTLPAALSFGAASAGCSFGGGKLTCSPSTLPAGQSKVITLTVTPTADGPVNTLAEVASAVTDPAPSGNSVLESTTINPKADLAIGQTAVPSPVAAGDTLTYTVVVTNNGPSTATGVIITDTLPTTVTFGSAVASQGSCNSGNPLTCSLGSLAKDAAATVTIRVTPQATGTLTNRAETGSSTADTTPANDASSLETTVTTKADVSLSLLDWPEPVTAGRTLTYTLIVTNNGPSTARNVSIAHTLPGGVTILSAPACTEADGVAVCSAGDLLKGDSASLTMTVAVSASITGTLRATATVSSGEIDPVPADNTATAQTAIVTQADVSVGKTASAPAVAGLPLTYTIAITNAGPSDARGVVLTDTLPPGATFLSAIAAQGTCQQPGDVVCSPGTLSPGQSLTVTVAVSVQSGVTGTLVNTATVSAQTTDPAPANDVTTATVTVSALADLAIRKTDAPDPVLMGAPLTYTLTITNYGPSDAPGVVVTDTAAATYTLGTLVADESRTIVLVVTPTVKGTLVNTATVAGSAPDPAPGNDSATASTVVYRLADLTTGIAAAPVPAQPGQPMTFTVAVTNNGPMSADDVTMFAWLPADVSFGSAAGCAESGGVVTCSLGTLVSGQASAATIVTTLSASAVNSQTITATATTSDVDPDGGNNMAIRLAPVAARADMQIGMSAAPSPVVAGSTLTYTIVVTNAGPASATDVTLNDTLPADFSLTAARPGQGTCTGTTAVRCQLGAMGVNQQVTVELAGTVSATAKGQLSNTASVTNTLPDMDAADNTVTVQTSLQIRTDLALTDDGTPAAAEPDSLLTYRFSVTNNGPSNATEVSVSGVLPADTSFVSASNCTLQAGNLVECVIGDMASQTTQPMTITVAVSDSASGTLSYNISTSGNELDPNTADNILAFNTSINTPVTTTHIVYLPLVLTPPMTSLSVWNDDTGGDVTFSVLGTGVSCTVGNNQTQFCGKFSPGTYSVQAITPCGTATSVKTYAAGPQTTRIACSGRSMDGVAVE